MQTAPEGGGGGARGGFRDGWGWGEEVGRLNDECLCIGERSCVNGSVRVPFCCSAWSKPGTFRTASNRTHHSRNFVGTLPQPQTLSLYPSHASHGHTEFYNPTIPKKLPGEAGFKQTLKNPSKGCPIAPKMATTQVGPFWVQMEKPIVYLRIVRHLNWVLAAILFMVVEP